MLAGVVTAAVEAMAGLGADPAGLWAAIGPAICGSCYEVPERMRQEAAAREPACAAATRANRLLECMHLTLCLASQSRAI